MSNKFNALVGFICSFYLFIYIFFHILNLIQSCCDRYFVCLLPPPLDGSWRKGDKRQC